METALHSLTREELIELAVAREQEQQSHLKLIRVQEQELSTKQQQLAKSSDRILTYEARVKSLEFQVTQLERLIFGSKRERFITDLHESQLKLSLENEEESAAVEAAVAAEVEKITYERKKTGKKHEGRMELPSHLPVVETVIEPTEDVTGMTCIGREVTDELELTPASLFINRTIRPKYAAPEAEDA